MGPTHCSTVVCRGCTCSPLYINTIGKSVLRPQGVFVRKVINFAQCPLWDIMRGSTILFLCSSHYIILPPQIFSRKIPVEAERTKVYLESHIHVQSVQRWEGVGGGGLAPWPPYMFHYTLAPNKLIQFCYFLPPPQ